MSKLKGYLIDKYGEEGMSRVKEYDDYMKEIFNDQEEKRQREIDELEELRYENKLLWAVIDRIKKEVNKV